MEERDKRRREKPTRSGEYEPSRRQRDNEPRRRQTDNSGGATSRRVKPTTVSTFNTSWRFSVKVSCGDITLVKTDAVATGEGLHTGVTSEVTRSLYEKIGPNFNIMRETLYLAHGSSITEGGAYVSKLPQIHGQTLPYSWIIHAILPQQSSGRRWQETLTSLYSNVCFETDKKGIKTLSLPLLGTGSEDVDTRAAINCLVAGLRRFGEKRQQSNLTEVHVVTLEDSLARHIEESIKHDFTKTKENKSDRVHDSTQDEGTHGERRTRDKPSRAQGGQQKDRKVAWKTRRSPRSPDRTRQAHPKSRFEDLDAEPRFERREQYEKNWREDSRDRYETRYQNGARDQSRGDPEVKNKSRTHGHRHKRDKSKDRSYEKDGNRSNRHRRTQSEDTAKCPICMDTIKDPKELSKCKHVFCGECIDHSFKVHKPVCPSCQTVYGQITGNMPLGTMDTDNSRSSLPGFPDCGTIIIRYHFEDGTQTSEHPQPGVKYQGTTRMAFLPNNKEGQKVYKLLRVAWERRLTFTIGRSTTTGRDNVVTWNDIHHKTNETGGEANFGYPDHSYLARVSEELASKGVTEDDI